MVEGRSTLVRVGEILSAIGKVANKRAHPREGDLEGDFDEWFDGGAVKNITGVTEYRFNDGSEARVAVTFTLSIAITLPDGKRIQVAEPE
jgi:hypothetical protein